ncbi:MAG: potassium-transporting ATPase subunit KdpA [Actinobacteria bacterium]|nr:potassium-transporting ATPase subunit KdpA [Actinomycetota bacterium]
MTPQGWLQILVLLLAVALLTKPMGAYMARVFEGKPVWIDRALGPVERFLYRVSGIDPDREMGWKKYALCMLAFNFAGFLLLYLIQRIQGVFPSGPSGLSAVRPDLAFNTAVSFVTNTNWQAYGGETTMKYVTQMIGMGVQNFLSAATGIAVAIALIRGFGRKTTGKLGNFWVDMTRATLYILLPISIVVAILLLSQGVVQTFHDTQSANLVQATTNANGATVTSQSLSVGPAASQIAIKQVGTNGGGFFNANSSHPFENPTPFSNFIEIFAILIIPAGLTYTFGRMVRSTRQGWTIFVVMMIILVGMIVAAYAFEARGVPQEAAAGANIQAVTSGVTAQPGGNMEGKETRFGIGLSAEWAVVTTGTSCGAVNSMHDSYTPLGGMIPLTMIHLGEVVFGGVGSGLYGILVFAVIAVFIAGLMVGRTPEYLGKKIEMYEMKMASLIILIPVVEILFGTAVALSTKTGTSSIPNPGPHGLTEVLYAFSSGSGNNGSAFAGLNANTTFYNIGLGLIMLIGRYWMMLPTLAIAGSLAKKKLVPVTAGTLHTDGPLFVGVLIAVIIIVAALSFFPALALGPIVEQLMM